MYKGYRNPIIRFSTSDTPDVSDRDVYKGRGDRYEVVVLGETQRERVVVRQRCRNLMRREVRDQVNV